MTQHRPLGLALAGAIVLSALIGPLNGTEAYGASSVDRWKATAIAAGWPKSSWPKLRCIIRLESGGNPRALGDRGTSYGLTQIHWPAHGRWIAAKGYGRTDLYNPRVNLAIARRIFKMQGWKAWSVNRRC